MCNVNDEYSSILAASWWRTGRWVCGDVIKHCKLTVRSMHSCIFVWLWLVHSDNSDVGLMLVFAVTRGFCVWAQTAYSFVTSGSPRSRETTSRDGQRSDPAHLAKSYLTTGSRHGVVTDAEGPQSMEWGTLTITVTAAFLLHLLQ